jgi:hypothetical protein
MPLFVTVFFVIRDKGGGSGGFPSSPTTLLLYYFPTPITPTTTKPTGTCLGAGSYGRVFKARWAGRDVAVKVRSSGNDTKPTTTILQL